MAGVVTTLRTSAKNSVRELTNYTTYLCNLAGTDYELPEDDALVSKHYEKYNKLSINCAFFGSLYKIIKDVRYKC